MAEDKGESHGPTKAQTLAAASGLAAIMGVPHILVPPEANAQIDPNTNVSDIKKDTANANATATVVTKEVQRLQDIKKAEDENKAAQKRLAEIQKQRDELQFGKVPPTPDPAKVAADIASQEASNKMVSDEAAYGVFMKTERAREKAEKEQVKNPPPKPTANPLAPGVSTVPSPLAPVASIPPDTDPKLAIGSIGLTILTIGGIALRFKNQIKRFFRFVRSKLPF